VTRRRLSDVDPADADRLRGLGLLLASVDELRGDSGDEGLGRLRAWAGAGPELVVTAGAAGAWFDDGQVRGHVPADVVQGRHTVGAGDAFAAVLVAGRGAGQPLEQATAAAAAATARFLATRPDPTTSNGPGTMDP
jgi:sugar/nucleoside kinase (ribokinase family)